MVDLQTAPPHYPKESRDRFVFNLSHEEMVRRFGAPHRAMDAEDNEPGPCDYWGYRIDGKDLLIVFHFAIPGRPSAVVASASTDIDGMIDALGVRELVVWRLEQDRRTS